MNSSASRSVKPKIASFSSRKAVVSEPATTNPSSNSGLLSKSVVQNHRLLGGKTFSSPFQDRGGVIQ